MKALTPDQAEALRVAVYEYADARANASAYRVRAVYSQDINERADHKNAVAYWTAVAEADKAKLAALGVVL